MPLFRGVSRPSSVFLALGILAAPTFGQSTGRLAGHIHDENEVSLPGATIIVSSPNLMGSRTEFGDAGGNFSFHSLPPGVYAIDVELEGFLPQRRSEVEVRLTIADWIAFYNLERPHSTLQGRTPAEFHRGTTLDATPKPRTCDKSSFPQIPQFSTAPAAAADCFIHQWSTP